MLENSNYIRI